MIILWQVGDRKEGEIQRQSNKNQQVNCREWRANWLTSGKRYELGDVIEVPPARLAKSIVTIQSQFKL